ncbi:MAG: DivIVA domain-containing protein [Mycoplasmatales bacterium]
MKKLINEILEKDFKSSVSGYNKEQVDEFLDFIIDSLENIEAKNKNLVLDKEELEKENMKLKVKILDLEESNNSKPKEEPKQEELTQEQRIEKLEEVINNLKKDK